MGFLAFRLLRVVGAAAALITLETLPGLSRVACILPSPCLSLTFFLSSTMLGSIGNDILDIGSRKATLAQEAAQAADPLGLGRPGQFEVPNVSDVRATCDDSLFWLFGSHVSIPVFF